MLAAAAAATISIVVLNATPLSVDVGDRLKKRISAASGKSLVHFSYNDEGTARLLKTFYQKRNGLPAWSHDEGPTEEAAILLQLLKRAYREGLYPQDYQADRIEDLMMALNKEKEEGRHLNPDQLVDLDLLLTEAFFSYAAHFPPGEPITSGNLRIWCINPGRPISSRHWLTPWKKGMWKERSAIWLPDFTVIRNCGKGLMITLTSRNKAAGR